jgi:integrase/recombinase XerD
MYRRSNKWSISETSTPLADTTAAAVVTPSPLKRKEISCYKPSDLWSQEDDPVFLKWVINKRDRCYHTMARDLSARPHEILNLKIKDLLEQEKGEMQSEIGIEIEESSHSADIFNKLGVRKKDKVPINH